MILLWSHLHTMIPVSRVHANHHSPSYLLRFEHSEAVADLAEAMLQRRAEETRFDGSLPIFCGCFHQLLVGKVSQKEENLSLLFTRNTVVAGMLFSHASLGACSSSTCSFDNRDFGYAASYSIFAIWQENISIHTNNVSTVQSSTGKFFGRYVFRAQSVGR